MLNEIPTISIIHIISIHTNNNRFSISLIDLSHEVILEVCMEKPETLCKKYTFSVTAHVLVR